MTTKPNAPTSLARVRRILLRASIGIGIALVLVEGLVRVLGIGPPVSGGGYERGLFVPDETLGFRMASGFSGIHESEGEIPIETNAAGYRDDEFGPKRDGVLRILSLSDSFGFGHGVHAVQSYPAVLEGLLGTIHRPVEVLNLGVPGYCTTQQQLQLELEGPDLAPDLVVLGLYVGNDPSGNIQWRDRPNSARLGLQVPRGLSFWDHVRLVMNAYSRTWRTGEELRRNRRRSRDESLTLEERRAAECPGLDWNAGIALAVLRKELEPDAEDAYALTVDALEAMRDFARDELGAPLVVVLLPAPHQYEPAMWAQLLALCAYDPAAFDLLRPQRELTEAAHELSIPLLDVMPALVDWTAAASAKPNGPRAYLDVHFSHWGNAVVAAEIARFLEEGGYL